MADTNNKIKATFAFAFSCIIIIYSSFLDIPVLSRICLYAMCFVFTSLVSIGAYLAFQVFYQACSFKDNVEAYEELKKDIQEACAGLKAEGIHVSYEDFR